MSIGSIVGSQVLGGVIGDVFDGLDRLITSDEERAQLDLARERLLSDERIKAIDLSIAQAQHPSVFVAGARPALIWLGVVSMGYAGLLQPLLVWATGMASAAIGVTIPPPPALAPEVLSAVMTIALGVAGLRTAEKWQGVARENLHPTTGVTPVARQRAPVFPRAQKLDAPVVERHGP